MDHLKENTFLVLRAIDQNSDTPLLKSKNLSIIHHGLGEFDDEKAMDHLKTLTGFRIEVVTADEEDDISMSIVSYPDGRMITIEIQWYRGRVSTIHVFDLSCEVATIVNKQDIDNNPNDFDLGKLIRHRLC